MQGIVDTKRQMFTLMWDEDWKGQEKKTQKTKKIPKQYLEMKL